MIAFEILTWRAAMVGRWTARILGTLMVLFFLALVFGEGPPNPFSLTWRENLSLLFITLMFVGLALAWRWEGWGGALTVASFGALVLISMTHLHMPAIQIPTAVGCLHLISWARLRGIPPDGAAFSVARGLAYAACTAMGVFLVLCANEIFGNPPLMTSTVTPGANITGTWTSSDGNLTIAANRQVTGVLNGTLMYNRSWFGKLMRWRTDYMIKGTSAGVHIIALLDVRDSEMRLWLTPPGKAIQFRHIQ